MPKFIDLAGRVFGWLHVLRRAENDKNGNAMWLCFCGNCLNHAIVQGGSLRSGATQSCGCLRREKVTTHGMHASPEYPIWKGMNSRCYNPKNSSFGNYGGRGITVCKRWRDSPEAFFADMGPKPSPKHTLDRIDNSKGYFPENCRWALPAEQARNRRSNVFITHAETGEKLCQVDWSLKLGGRPPWFVNESGAAGASRERYPHHLLNQKKLFLDRLLNMPYILNNR